MGCCIQVDTIQSLLDDGRDAVEEILTGHGLDTDILNLCSAAMTSMYRYRMIGSCDVDRWIQAMKDRMTLTLPAWDIRFRIWKANTLDPDLSDLSDRKRTVTENVDTTTTDNTDSEREDIPETADAANSRYLSERSNTDRSIDADLERSLTETERNGQYFDALGRSIRDVPNVFMEWARVFDDLFLARW